MKDKIQNHSCEKCNSEHSSNRLHAAFGYGDSWVCPKCSHVNNFEDTVSCSETVRMKDEMVQLKADLDTVSPASKQISGKKNDQQKNRLDLIHPVVIEELGKVLTMGANKYGAGNYQQGIDYNRVYGAALRHLIAFWQGEDTDKESGFMHLSHCLCNIAFLVEYESNRERYKKFDNRPEVK